MAANFYDHAKNHANPAVAEAVARVRRESLAAGEAYRVEFNWPGQSRHYWEGGRYDCLQLARDLAASPRCENVTLTDPAGRAVDLAAARY